MGTEPNETVCWNGKWETGVAPREGPGRYVAAYRHIVDLMSAEEPIFAMGLACKLAR